MKKSITHQETAWLVLRTIGLVFAWLALTKIAGFAWTAHILTTDGLTQIRESLGGALSWEMAWPQAFMFLAYVLLAFYFLRHGHYCHSLICFEGRTKHDTPPERTDENDW